MVVIGLLLFGVAVAAGVVLVAQNNDAMFTLHALGNSWTIHVYWMLVIGLVILAVGLLGLTIMRAGAVRYRRLRREHQVYVRDRERAVEDYPTGPTPTATTETRPAAEETHTASDQRSRGFFGARHGSAHG